MTSQMDQTDLEDVPTEQTRLLSAYVSRPYPRHRASITRIRHGQLTSLMGVLYACAGGIIASQTLLLTKSGQVLFIILSYILL